MARADGMVDLRSDTVTTPSPEMRRAMAEAEVGDDVYGEDPTVAWLESLSASLTGKEASVYVPSGTMANQLAIRVLTRPGTDVLCAARAHVVRYEAAAAAWNSGVQMRTVPDDRGTIDPDAVTDAIAGRAHHLPEVSLVCLENTHMPSSGRPLDADEVSAVAGAARAGGAAAYVDGARIWNAAIALESSPAALLAAADAAMFCLSKGLGAPVGSVLCGSAALVAEARAWRQRFGGAMRQAGVIAAAGVVALETMVERLADDHRRARRIADALAERYPVALDPAVVRTNIVCAEAAALPPDFLRRLADAGVLAGTIDPRTVRLVTHKDVDDADVERVLAAL